MEETFTGFSALQRAENSSIYRAARGRCTARRFSALQRAENSSIPDLVEPRATRQKFQCSSASRKFLNERRSDGNGHILRVSVLFSEPKIPQFFDATGSFIGMEGFSALQRAENSSIV